MRVRFLGSMLAGALIAMAGPLSVSADNPVISDTLTFDGIGTATPSSLTGGQGTYTFSAPSGTAGICQVVSDTPAVDNGEVGTCTLTSQGAYSFTVCGTGTAVGSADITEPNGTSEHYVYTVVIVAGIATIVAVGTSDGESVSETIVGTSLLTPTSTDPTQCVTTFNILFTGVAIEGLI